MELTNVQKLEKAINVVRNEKEDEIFFTQDEKGTINIKFNKIEFTALPKNNEVKFILLSILDNCYNERKRVKSKITYNKSFINRKASEFSQDNTEKNDKLVQKIIDKNVIVKEITEQKWDYDELIDLIYELLNTLCPDWKQEDILDYIQQLEYNAELNEDKSILTVQFADENATKVGYKVDNYSKKNDIVRQIFETEEKLGIM